MRKTYRIGFLGAESAAYDAPRIRILQSGLRELGYPEKSISVESRFAEGVYDRLPALAADLVALRVDAIVCSGSKAGLAASHATTTIPVIVSNMGDALNPGFVGSYSQPGRNVTGMSQLNPEVAAKLVELLHQLKPRSTGIAVLVNPANPNTGLIRHALQRAADTLKVRLEMVEVRAPSVLESAFEAMQEKGIDALVVQSETMFAAHALAIATFAIKHRIATAGTSNFAHAGGLIGYSSNREEAFRHLVDYVDKVLRGATPASLPVEQPSKVELTINLKTARALRITIPKSLLLRANEVIQ